MGGLGGFVPPNPKSRQKLSKKNGIKSVGYTFRFKKKSKSPPHFRRIFQSWRRHCGNSVSFSPFSQVLISGILISRILISGILVSRILVSGILISQILTSGILISRISISGVLFSQFSNDVFKQTREAFPLGIIRWMLFHDIAPIEIIIHKSHIFGQFFHIPK